jgi:Flp pilus assembly protein CpaB
MKLNRTIIACAVLGVAGFFSSARAEMPSAEPTAGSSSAHPSKPRTRIESLTEKLHLTEAQKLQVGAIIKDQQAADAALKADTVASADVKKAKRREIKEAHNTQIRAALSPEQQVVFDETTLIGFAKKKK